MKRFEQVPHGHLEVQAALPGDLAVDLDVFSCLLDLFAEDLFIQRHNDDVVEIEGNSRVVKDADDVREVIQLVFGEELIVQIEGSEDHVHLRHVVLVGRVEGVVQARELRASGIDQTKIPESRGFELAQPKVFIQVGFEKCFQLGIGLLGDQCRCVCQENHQCEKQCSCSIEFHVW